MLIQWHRLPVLVTLLVVALLASAQTQANEEALREYVERNTEQLVKKLNEERGLYKKDPEAFYQSMDQALSDFVDFRRIAARVMGRYARQASPEQRDEFVKVFKRSLFDSYAQALVNSDDFTIRVIEATIDPNNDGRALVNMEVETASGTTYPVTYSMYRNDQGKWLMENIIVEGVNIGLAFRDRFAQDMEKYRGNIDKVIAGWSDAAQTIDLDGGDNKQ